MHKDRGCGKKRFCGRNRPRTLSTPMILKVFSYSPLQTQILSIPPQQRSHTIIEKISHYLLWKNRRGLWTKHPFITSDTAVKAACTCKLLRLLPGRMVRLIMELVDNRSFTPTTANGKRSRLPRLKIGVLQGSGLESLLFNICTYYILTSIQLVELPRKGATLSLAR